jgi:hypothetical protein
MSLNCGRFGLPFMVTPPGKGRRRTAGQTAAVTMISTL